MKRIAPILAFAIASVSSAAHAQVDNAGVLDQALKQYRTAAEGWQSAGQGAATALFWSLATISLVWTMGQLVLRRSELGEFFGELIRYLLFTGFWAFMLENGPAHAQLIIESMIKLGGGASGQNMMTPSGVLDVGFHLVDRALTQSSILSPLDSAFGIVLALVILVVLALVGVNMLVTLIACWIVAYGGLIVLGFGGSRWTSDMASNYYRMVLSLGLQVLAMVLLVGVGESFLRGYYGALDQDVSLHEQAVLLVVSIVLLVTVNRVPALLGTLANGSSPQYALGSGAGVGAALSTASAAGALAATASRPALEGTGQLAKAAAVAAVGGGGAVAASLIESFRSHEAERASNAGGGSVFPAPAPAAAVTRARGGQQAMEDGAASESASDSPRGERGEGKVPVERHAVREERGPEQVEGVKGAASAGGIERDSPRLALHSRFDDQGAGGAEPVASSGAQYAQEQAAHGRVDESVTPRAQQNSGPDERMHEPSSRTAPAGTSKAEPPTPGGFGAPEQAAASAGHVTHNATAAPSQHAVSPAGTFAQAPIAVHSWTAITSSPATPGSGAPTNATAPRSHAPVGALTAAIAAAASPPDVPFSAPRSADMPAASHRPAAALARAGETLDRAELPAAYSQQTTVDVEAEVAAFKDRD